MSDIVERARAQAQNDRYEYYGASSPYSILLDEAADEIEKLREALKPFAQEAQFISPHAEDTWFYYDGIRFGDLRTAAAALKETEIK